MEYERKSKTTGLLGYKKLGTYRPYEKAGHLPEEMVH